MGVSAVGSLDLHPRVYRSGACRVEVLIRTCVELVQKYLIRGPYRWLAMQGMPETCLPGVTGSEKSGEPQAVSDPDSGDYTLHRKSSPSILSQLRRCSRIKPVVDGFFINESQGSVANFVKQWAFWCHCEAVSR